MDFRHAVRNLMRRPLFTLAAVLTLAIGMGVNAVAFTVVNSVFFKGAAGADIPGAGRISPIPADESGGVSREELARYADATRGAVRVAAEGRLSMAWRHEGGTETVWALMVSGDYFPMLDPRPLAGRVHVAPGRGSVPAAVVGERFWRLRLQGAPLAGLTLRINNVDVSVSGVLPTSYRGPGGVYAPDVWLPLDDLGIFHVSPQLDARDTRWLSVIARIEPSATAAEANARLAGAAAAMAQEWPATHANRSARFAPFSEQPGELTTMAAPAAAAMGIIGLVLLLACFNVANLLLARAVEREREMGIRVALGARSGRIVRLVVGEGLLVSAAAGVAALLLAWWAQRLVGAFAIPIAFPQYLDLTPDATVIAFIAALVLVAGVLPGVWPAIVSARVNVLAVLGAQGGGSVGGRPSAFRAWLVGAQVAGSTALLAIATLFVQSYAGAAAADIGFERDHLVVAQLDPSSHGFDPARARRYAQALGARLGALPGVAGVAVVDRIPFYVGYPQVTRVWPATGDCADTKCPQVTTYLAGPGYFDVMGIALRQGREFGPAEGPGVIVNEAFARKTWPNGDALGSTLRLGAAGDPATVVGIVANVSERMQRNTETPLLYLPMREPHYAAPFTVVVRTAGPPLPLILPLIDAANEVDGDIALQSVETMAQRLELPLWPVRTLSGVFGICGLLALVLATVGLAGVVAHAVTRRTREFGVRLSMGATPRDLAGGVLRQGATLLVPGLVAGLALAAGAARLGGALFVGINVLDPLTYLGVAAVQALVVTLACLAPALRAARVDPLVALRAD